jgi:flavin reductase (DIM6/NTAB) family NADH-FMN oxidoreductase RutF
MRKVETHYLEYFWPMRHYLITCGSGAESNVVAVSFCMPVAKEPPMVACAIGRDMWSAELIDRHGEFVVNVPAQELRREVYYCGTHSGRDVDKFEGAGLTRAPARHAQAPIVAECVAHVECEVEDSLVVGDKVLFAGVVLDAYADEDVASGAREVEFASGAFPTSVYGTRF